MNKNNISSTQPSTVSHPMVSVIVAAYGQEAYLGEALESLISQTYSDWEAIVVDDGSPDNVMAIGQEYSSKDSRIRLIHSENRGAAGVRNLAVSFSRAKYLLFLDGDDRIDADYIEKCVEEMERYPDLEAVFGNLRAFGKENYLDNVTYTSYPALLINNPLFISGLIHRDRFNSIGGFDEYFKKGLEDWEFWIRFLRNSGKDSVRILYDTLFYYRKKNESTTTHLDSNADLMVGYRHKIFEKHKEVYKKYFGREVEEWMVMGRSYVSELRFLLLPSFIEASVSKGKKLKEMFQGLMYIGADRNLSSGQREKFLTSIFQRQAPIIEAHWSKLSVKQKFRWKVLEKSVKLFIKYAEFKRKPK